MRIFERSLLTFLCEVAPASRDAYLAIPLAPSAPQLPHPIRALHVHVMRRQIQRNQALAQKRIFGPRGAQITQQTTRRAPIRHHIQYRSKLGRLVEGPSRKPIQGIEKTRDRICREACQRVDGHVVERDQGEDNTRVACDCASVTDNQPVGAWFEISYLSGSGRRKRCSRRIHWGSEGRDSGRGACCSSPWYGVMGLLWRSGAWILGVEMMKSELACGVWKESRTPNEGVSGCCVLVVRTH